jgi:hypothetical protein
MGDDVLCFRFIGCILLITIMIDDSPPIFDMIYYISSKNLNTGTKNSRNEFCPMV